MSDFPSRQEVLALHQYSEGPDAYCLCGHPEPLNENTDMATHQLAILGEACRVTTVDQLDALVPDPSGYEGHIVKDATGEIWEANDDGSWTKMGTSGSRAASDIELPALLLWSPDWQQP